MFAASVLVLFITAQQTPKEPDFSGDWVLVQASGQTTEPASALIVRQQITRTTARGEPMPPRFSDLSVERHFTKGVESERYKIGIMGGNVSSIGEWTTEAVTWEGASLIIRRGKYSGPPQQTKPNAEREEVWTFDPAGRLSITISDRSSGSAPTTVRLIYRRQPSPVAMSFAGRGVCEREACDRSSAKEILATKNP
jgi:hypothetical protein